MEDFLKDKVSELESNFQDDWNVFEQKLERALFFKRLRIGAALSLVLIATSIGIFGTSSIAELNTNDEAAFGVYTEDGFETIGSKSGWKGSGTSASDIAYEEGAAAAINTIVSNNNISAKNALQTEVARAEDIGEDVKMANTSVLTAPVSIKAGQGGAETFTAGESLNITEATSTNTSEGETTATDYALNTDAESSTKMLEKQYEAMISSSLAGKSTTEEEVWPPQFKKVQALMSDESESEANEFEPAYEPSANVNRSNAAISGGRSTVGVHNSMGSDIIAKDGEAFVADEDMVKQAPISLSALQLDVPKLATLGNHEGYYGQMRMPVSTVRAAPVSKGPFISPLQNKSLWEYSIKVYPNFTFRKFKVGEDKANYIHRDFVDQVKASESGGFSLNIGLEVSRKIGLATYLKSGVEYISYNHSANFDFTNYRSANIDYATGAIKSYSLLDEPNQVVINDKNTYHYLNLPLSISYQPWASEHIRLNMEAGVSYMYFVAARGASIDYRTLEVIDLSEREFKNSLGSVNLRIGATYYISPQFNLGFEPTFVYFTNTIYSDDYPFEVIPYSVGINLKLQVKLN
jgi:hypothetical protein